VDLLKQTASLMFVAVHRAFVDGIILHIAKLLEKPQASSGHGKLTLARMPPLIGDVRLRADVRHLVSEARRVAFGFVVPWRDRQIAHLDIDLALEVSDPLPGVTQTQIAAALQAIRAVMNRVEWHYWKSVTKYEDAIYGVGRDGDQLIYVLKQGLRAHSERIRRIREGKALPGDLTGRGDDTTGPGGVQT